MRFYITFFLTLFYIIGVQFSTLKAQQAPNYENTIRSANEKFDSKDYISAKTYYEMALRLKADDAFASKRLSETITLIQKQMELQEVFYKYLDQGDQLQKTGSETEALAQYKKALEIFPQDKYVSAQVTAISEKLRLVSEKNQLFEQYSNLGNKLLTENKLDEAIVQFNLANELIPNDKQILSKINEIQLAISKRNENEKIFQQLILDADSQVKRKNYPQAIEKLKEALKILPENTSAINKLTEAQALATQQKAYNDQVANADIAYEQKDLESARNL
jgi:tetratricopeptide (TPR) repeat protein